MTQQLITIPDTCAASAVIGLERVVGETTSPFSFSSQQYDWGGERWRISFSLPNIVDRSLAGQWKAFGAAMRGKYNIFLCGDPLGKVPTGIATGTPLVDGGGQTGNTLNTKGWSNNITGILNAGDYFQLGTGVNARLYMLTETANSDGSGEATLRFEPALRSSPADNAAVIIDNPRGAFRLTSNSFSWSISPGSVYRMSFDAVEVVSA